MELHVSHDWQSDRVEVLSVFMTSSPILIFREAILSLYPFREEGSPVPLNSVAAKKQWKRQLTQEEWLITERLRDLLNPFLSATKLLEAGKTPTISFIVPVIFWLFTKLQNAGSSSYSYFLLSSPDSSSCSWVSPHWLSKDFLRVPQEEILSSLSARSCPFVAPSGLRPSHKGIVPHSRSQQN